MALYVVATPIGNLEDISYRALRVLREVDIIAAEDTRTTRRLLKAYEINTPLTSYFEHNKLTKLEYILEMLEAKDVALVSDAGMPGISDPGYELVCSAIEKGIKVIPIPGPNAAVSALSVSGLPTNEFTFLGFLPRKTGERKRFLATIASERRTLVFYEAPHRVLDTLADIGSILGDRKIAVCRELTKVFEEIFRGTVSDAEKHFVTPRGEFTIVLEGAPTETEKPSADTVSERLAQLRHSGLSGKDIVKQVAEELGLPRKEVYRLWLDQS